MTINWNHHAQNMHTIPDYIRHNMTMRCRRWVKKMGIQTYKVNMACERQSYGSLLDKKSSYNPACLKKRNLKADYTWMKKRIDRSTRFGIDMNNIQNVTTYIVVHLTITPILRMQRFCFTYRTIKTHVWSVCSLVVNKQLLRMYIASTVYKP